MREPSHASQAAPSDEALFADFAATGDRDALQALVARWWEPAIRLARRVLADPAAAEDAAQEAMVSLARSGGAALRGPFAPWFRTLVLNAARNVARSESRRGRHEGDSGCAGAARDRAAALEPERIAGHSLDREVVLEHLRRLPGEARFALAFHFFEGRSHAEVGAALGCPPKTATSRIRRGLERLRASLGASGYASALGEIEAALRAIPASAGLPDTGSPEASPGTGAIGDVAAAVARIAAAPTAEAILARAAALARRALLEKVAAATLVALLCVAGPGRALLRPHEAPASAIAIGGLEGDARANADVLAGATGDAGNEGPAGRSPSGEAWPPDLSGPEASHREPSPPPPRADAPTAPAPGPGAAAASPGDAPAAPTVAALARLRVEVDLSAVTETSALLFVVKDAEFVGVDRLGGDAPEKVFELAADLYHVYAWPGAALEGMSNPALVEEVRLAPGEERTLRMSFPPPDMRVGIELEARLSDGGPARGVTIKVQRDLGAVEPARRSRYGSAAADASGKASFGIWPPGEYVVSSPGYGAVARIAHTGRLTRALVVLPPLSPTRLRITDELGAPVAGIRVEVVGLLRSESHCVSGQDGVLSPVHIDERGARQLGDDLLDLPLGEIELRLRGAEQDWLPMRFVNTGRGEVAIVLPGRTSLDVAGTLAHPGDAPDGTPVQAQVVLPGGAVRGASGIVKDGAFRLAIEGVSPTARPAEVALRIGRAVPVGGTVGTGDSSLRIDGVRLEPGLSLSGRLTLNGAAAIAMSTGPGVLESGQVIFRSSASVLPIAASFEVTDGRFLLEGLPPGPGRIEVRGPFRSAQGMMASGADVSVDPSQVACGDVGEIVLRFSPGRDE